LNDTHALVCSSVTVITYVHHLSVMSNEWKVRTKSIWLLYILWQCIENR